MPITIRFKGFDDEWKTTKIGECLDVKYGKDYKHMNTGKYPVLGTGGVMEYVDDFLYSGESILIGRKGTIDKPSYINDAFWTVDTLFYTEIKKQFPKFLFYCISNINWLKYNEASGVPSLSANNIKNVKINVPNLNEQKKIANFLTTVDEKIELLEKKYESYLNFKKYLMQQIFTQKSRFDFNDNWYMVKLGDIVKLMRNGSNANQVNYKTDFPVTRIETISKGVLNYDKLGFVEKIDESYRLQHGDILLSNINSLKYIGNCIYFDDAKTIYHGMNLMLIRFKDEFNKKYLFYYMKFYKNWFQKMACQAVNQASINQSSLKKFPFYIPQTIEEQNKIVNILDNIETKIQLIENCLLQMKKFKKGLLQQMFV